MPSPPTSSAPSSLKYNPGKSFLLNLSVCRALMMCCRLSDVETERCRDAGAKCIHLELFSRSFVDVNALVYNIFVVSTGPGIDGQIGKQCSLAVFQLRRFLRVWYLILVYFLFYLCFSPIHSSFTLTFLRFHPSSFNFNVLLSFFCMLCSSISFSNYAPPSLTSSPSRNLLACGAASAWIQIPLCMSSNIRPIHHRGWTHWTGCPSWMLRQSQHHEES